MPRNPNPKTEKEIQEAIQWYKADLRFVNTETKFRYQHEITVLKEQLKTLNSCAK